MNNLNNVSVREQFESRSGVYAHAQFGRVVTAMVTPFTEGGQAVNYEAAQQLAQYLEQNGSEGLVVAGTTGESATLSHIEQIDLIGAVHEAVEIPILAGTGSNNTVEAVQLTNEVTERGIADGLLVVSPYYNRPPQSGIVDYFEHIAETTNLPIVMYDIPIRTGRGMSTDTILRLAEEQSNIVGLKDASGEPERTAALLHDLPEGFQVYSGDDALNLRLYRAGAVGAISVASHWAGRAMQHVFNSEDMGETETADIFDRFLQEGYGFVSSEIAPNPLPVKAMLRFLLNTSIEIGYCRSPMIISRAQEATLEEIAMDVDAEYGMSVSFHSRKFNR